MVSQRHAHGPSDAHPGSTLDTSPPRGESLQHLCLNAVVRGGLGHGLDAITALFLGLHMPGR